MKWTDNHLVRHGIFWLVYWLVMGFIGGRYDLQFARAYTHEAMELPLRMAMVYAVLARTPVLGKGNWWRWLAEVLAILVAATLLGRLQLYLLIHPMLYAQDYTMEYWAMTRILLNFLDFALTLFLVLSLRFARQYMEFSAQKQQLLLEKTTAELHALRSQTNPHFLFNTLTNIYVLARKNAPETADVVHRLSQLLRYMLYECAAPTIPLERELHIAETYIDLEKLRFGERLSIKSTQEMDQPQHPVPPLLLLPLFENAFKHGAGESRFSIEIEWVVRLQQGDLYFQIRNSKETNPKNAPTDLPAGIGLANLRKQLDLLYPGAYSLDIEESAEQFSVTLHIRHV
ncbi:MAG: sensor histidine kinase [Saprospiraceae bacterium]|nr:sensor histidine kinase [Saprospiraceae bacterium]